MVYSSWKAEEKEGDPTMNRQSQIPTMKNVPSVASAPSLLMRIGSGWSKRMQCVGLGGE